MLFVPLPLIEIPLSSSNSRSTYFMTHNWILTPDRINLSLVCIPTYLCSYHCDIYHSLSHYIELYICPHFPTRLKIL